MRNEHRHQHAGKPRDHGRSSETYPEIGDDIELAEPERIGTDTEIGSVPE